MSDNKTFIIKYDDQSLYWTRDPKFNDMYVQYQHRQASGMLHLRGHLFLNEILDMLGLPRTSQGQLFGWLYSVKEPVTFWSEVRQIGHNWIILEIETHGIIYDKIEDTP